MPFQHLHEPIQLFEQAAPLYDRFSRPIASFREIILQLDLVVIQTTNRSSHGLDGMKNYSWKTNSLERIIAL